MGTHDEAQAVRILEGIADRLGIDINGIFARGRAREVLDSIIEAVRTYLPLPEAVGLSADTCPVLGPEQESTKVEEPVLRLESYDGAPFPDEPII